MGGQRALGVALVMECWPEKWRPMLAGVMGAAANIGFLLVGVVAQFYPVTSQSWRWMLLVAALPALLVVFLTFFTPESQRLDGRGQMRTGDAIAGSLRPQAHPANVFSASLSHRSR